MIPEPYIAPEPVNFLCGCIFSVILSSHIEHPISDEFLTFSSVSEMNA